MEIIGERVLDAAGRGGGERFSLGQSWEYLCMYVRSRYYMNTRREN